MQPLVPEGSSHAGAYRSLQIVKRYGADNDDRENNGDSDEKDKEREVGRTDGWMVYEVWKVDAQ